VQGRILPPGALFPLFFGVQICATFIKGGDLLKTFLGGIKDTIFFSQTGETF